MRIMNKFILIITILAQIRISYQLGFIQSQIKKRLDSSTADLDLRMKVDIAGYLKSFISSTAILPTSTVSSLNEIMDEYKKENEDKLKNKAGLNSQIPNIEDVEYIYSNTFANKLQENVPQEELNRFVKSMDLDEQSSKMSSARYLTIYLEKELQKVAEQFTQRFEKVIDKLTTDTINEMNKDK